MLKDLTDELRTTHGEFLLDNSIVILTASQLEILKGFLEQVRRIGDGLNFVIERAIDHRPGHTFSWDNDGSREQDARLEWLIARLLKDLGFGR